MRVVHCNKTALANAKGFKQSKNIIEGEIPHQFFIQKIVRVSYLKHVITISNMILTLIDFI